MAALVSYFDPQPDAADLPRRLPDPFAPQPPALIAQRAAQALAAELAAGEPVSAQLFEGPRKGKMFGVLVVADAVGRVGFLRGFSGMIEGSWRVPGFVGPLFAEALRDAVWPAGRDELASFDRQLQVLAEGPERAAAIAALARLQATHARDNAALAETHDLRRQGRFEQRAADARLDQSPDDRAAAEQTRARESRADTVMHRQQRRLQREQLQPLALVLRELEERRIALQRQRAVRSCELLEQLFAGYQIESARGQRRSLRDLFAPAAPPGGAGDCAGPKLFAHALRAGLRPIALAEFWVGTPPSNTGRHGGIFHPSCTHKCGPVLRHMLDGLSLGSADD
jgi:tRNA pseudouridine32 synthase/23S rRNA pseudouridine746 synthase